MNISDLLINHTTFTNNQANPDWHLDPDIKKYYVCIRDLDPTGTTQRTDEELGKLYKKIMFLPSAIAELAGSQAVTSAELARVLAYAPGGENVCCTIRSVVFPSLL
jgi:hypothetical protein